MRVSAACKPRRSAAIEQLEALQERAYSGILYVEFDDS
jgi:hypothetical protein